MTQYNIYGDDIRFAGKTSYIMYFSLFEEAAAEQRMYTLPKDFQKTFPNAYYEDADHPIFHDFQIAQNFLHGGGLPFECWRVLLCDIPVSMVKASVYIDYKFYLLHFRKLILEN